jgi:cyclic-di-GMP phosphodiesterase TipF (flagellum assembly factor)
MTRALIVLTYLLASATAAIAIFMVAGVPVGLLTGAVLALGSIQVHAALHRRGERRRVEREIAGLKQVSLQFHEALTETRARMGDLARAMAAKAADDLAKATEARATEVRMTEAKPVTFGDRKIVAELQVLERMRSFATKVTSGARAEVVLPSAAQAVPEVVLPSAPQAMPAAANVDAASDSGLLETIRDALEQNRVDLYLQPIVSLPQRKLRFYEALSRLRSEDGKIIMPDAYIKVAAPAGLMSVVDNLLLFRCVQIVRRLAQKQREVGVFCNISGETLADAEFFPQFLEYMHHNRDLAGHMVFEFDQDAVAKAGPPGQANLAYLASLGFELSMDHVSSLALDFAKLSELGFRHLKVRAHTLTHGMDGAQAVVAAEDLKKLLERVGLNLIAERVEDEKTVVQLLDYGVDFAQGYLFGEPRAVREDALKSVDAPAVVPFMKTG